MFTMNVIMLHGGAGSTGVEQKLMEYAVKSKSGSALDSVCNAVVLMENDPCFNAGTGSCMRLDGSIQMDAAVMTSKGFGSVMAIENVKNPVLVARAVMERSPHLIMAGDGAEKFAHLLGFEKYDPSTERAAKRRENDISMILSRKIDSYNKMMETVDISKFVDTVGAVARVNGEFAAAVSTGGAPPMLRGRVGDSPVPGAGIFCGENGAVVATGVGEEIIKNMLCISIYNEIGRESLSKIVMKNISRFRYHAGVIAVSNEEYFAYSNTDMSYAALEF
ncbi:asparaginase [Picrophilus oshimae DSM 9789]|uniref:Plant-type L-asparaginase n=2 Tax=Picrophilus oshimae TaxID=46632 RepID=A0A8G2L751_PICTO|nr:asparaginase [Picrophilus oshimae DSM 9789]